jgi:hypothetical protein
MDNKTLFIDGYLNRIAEKFNVNRDCAFEIFAIAAITERPFQEIYDEVLIKGSRDGGIDGALFVEQGGYYTLIVFQCKNSRGLQQNELDKFRRDVDDLFIHGISKPNAEHVRPKIDEYRQLSTDGYIVEIRRYFVYAGANEDPNYSSNIQMYRAYHSPNEYFEIWDSQALYGKIGQLIKIQNQRKDIRFVFHPQISNIITSDKQGIYTYSVGNVRAANFRIEAKELCKLVDDEVASNNTYEFLFSDNIRSFLGFRVRPNQRMKQTLNDLDAAIYFPLLNNGVTIICERMEIPSTLQGGNYILPSHNPVIVNGLQTTRVIYDVYKEGQRKGIDTLPNVFVNIRLYETSNTEIVDRITDATNTQTPITYKDKVSNKDFNLYVKEVFQNQGIAYITKRGEVFSDSLSKRLKDTIESDTLLRFWYATFYEQPETAKNSVYEVMEVIFDAANDNHPLKRLFNGNKDSPIYQQLLYAYTIYRYVQQEKVNQLEQMEYISHTSEILAYGSYKYLENNLADIHNPVRLKEAYEYALSTVEKIVAKQIETYKKQDKIFSFSSYFRKPRCRFDYNLEANIIEDDALLESLMQKR